MCTEREREGVVRDEWGRAFMTRKLAARRVLIWLGGKKPLTWPRRPRGSCSCPGFSAMLRWNSHAAARDGWYGCTYRERS